MQEQLGMRRPNLNALPEMPPLPSGYSLRECREDERDALAALLQTAFAMEWTPQRVHDEFFANERVKKTFVVDFEAKPVATASVYLPDPFTGAGVIHYVAADPQHSGKRLGYTVSLAVLQELARLGCTAATLRTDDFRLPAIKTYFNLGFVPEYFDESHRQRWEKVLAALSQDGR